MATVECERKWRFVLLLLVFEVCIPVCYAVVSASNNTKTVERVGRRQSIDFYYYINTSNSFSFCGPDGSTYLISEQRCIMDQELLRGIIKTINILLYYNNYGHCYTF